MRISIIGAGKMGLPLACHFASRGATVTACDVNSQLVERINRGECPIDEPGVPELLASAVASGRLNATTDTVAAVAASDVVIVIVPVLLTEDNHAELSIMTAVTAQVAQGLHPGMLVCYETTVPVGTTRNVLRPILEQSGMVAGEDFHLAYSPERVKSQLVIERLEITPKVVGGVNQASASRAEEFYETWLGAPITNVGSLEAAELVKVAGMLYRDVNIALSNQLAIYAEKIGIDLGPVIDAANTDGEAYLLTPGIGVGGHCTPVYPYFLIHDAREKSVPITLAEEARGINDRQSQNAVARLERSLGSLEGKQVMILGLGFRPQVKEHICSPAFLLRERLTERGANVVMHDPLYSDEEIRAHGFEPASLDVESAPAAIVLNTAHDEYGSLDFASLAAGGLQAVVDGRNSWNPEMIRNHGLIYLGIGRPEQMPSTEVTA